MRSVIFVPPGVFPGGDAGALKIGINDQSNLSFFHSVPLLLPRLPAKSLLLKCLTEEIEP